MKWIALAFFSIFFYEVQAQSVCLHLLENSIKMKNDTLFLKFKIQNNGTETLVFYNLNATENGMSFFIDSSLKKRMPSLLVDVMNAKNELPSLMRTRTMPLELLKNLPLIGKYHLVKPNTAKEYDVALDIWPIYLQKGVHKIQLRYYSNNYYDKNFKKAKNTDLSLKNSILFKGIIRSNIITYTVN